MPAPRHIQQFSYAIANRTQEVDALKSVYDRKVAEIGSGTSGSTVVSLFGISGTGKTSVLNMFNKTEKPDYIYLDLKEIADEVQIMEMIWANLVTKYDFKFMKFEWALYKYRLAYNPTGDNRADMNAILKRSKFLQNFADILKNIPTVNVVVSVAESIAKVGKMGINYLTSLKGDIQEMDNLEPSVLKRRLSAYLASDIEENLSRLGKPMIIELDSAESIIRPSFRGSHESWLMNIPTGVGNDDYNGITVLTPHIVWLFAGREKITWDKDSEDWNDGSITHIPLELFTYEQTCEYLNENRIDKEYHRPIYTSTKGNPEHINYCINLIMKKEASGDRVSATDLSKGIEGILKDYISYFSDSEIKALFMLMILNRWTENDIKFAKKEWDYVDTLTYSALKEYSFIREHDCGDFTVMEFDSSFRKVMRTLSTFGPYRELAEEIIDETLFEVLDYYLESIQESNDRFSPLNHLRIKSVLDGITLINDPEVVDDVLDEYFLDLMQWEISTSNPMDVLDLLEDFTSAFAETFPYDDKELSQLHLDMFGALVVLGHLMAQSVSTRSVINKAMKYTDNSLLGKTTKTESDLKELLASYSTKELLAYKDYLQDLYETSDLYPPLKKSVITILLCSILEVTGDLDRAKKLIIEYEENIKLLPYVETNQKTDAILEVSTLISKKMSDPNLIIDIPDDYIDAIVKTTVPFLVDEGEVSEEDTDLGYRELLEKIDIGLYDDDDIKDILISVLENDTALSSTKVDLTELPVQKLVDLTSDEDSLMGMKTMESNFLLVIQTLYYTGRIKELTEYLGALSRCFVLERVELIEEHVNFIINPLMRIYGECKNKGILDEGLAEVIQTIVNNYVARLFWNNLELDDESLPPILLSLADYCHAVDLKEDRDTILEECLDILENQYGTESSEYSFGLFNTLFYRFEDDVSGTLEEYKEILEAHPDFRLNPARMIIMLGVVAKYPECRQLLRDMGNKSIEGYDPNDPLIHALFVQLESL